MRYLNAYTIWFRRKDWYIDLLLMAVVRLIPYAGDMVLIGYESDVFLAHRDRPAADPPKFEFSRFADYLRRGVWPFLVFLLAVAAGMIVILPMQLVVILTLLAVKMPPALLVVLWICWVLVAAALMWVVFALAAPLMLRSFLMQSFRGGFNGRFYRDFLRRTAGPLALGLLTLAVGTFVLMLAGLIMCYIGVFITTALAYLAWWRMLLMLYEEYLARGGTPVPVALTPTPAPAFPVVIAPPPAPPPPRTSPPAAGPPA